MLQLVIQIVFSFASTVTFGILTNIPRHALVACGITGTLGWMGYWLAHQQGIGIGVANFIGAILIGLASIFFSRKKKMPMILFNIPSLVPLVPGGPAYLAVRELAQNNIDAALSQIAVVLVTAGAIAIGFMFTSLVESIYYRIWSRYQSAGS